MSQSLTCIPMHVIFSTKDRRNFILPKYEEALHKYICGYFYNIKARIYQIGGVEDHIHLFFEQPKTIAISKLVGDVKANSSKWIKTLDPELSLFAWQNGYGGFVVPPVKFEAVIKYIQNQKEHHGKMTFKEELIKFLKAHNLKYDENHLWD